VHQRVRLGLGVLVHHVVGGVPMTDDYDPAADGFKSYEAAIAAKKARGDVHDWIKPKPNQENEMNATATNLDAEPIAARIDASTLGLNTPLRFPTPQDGAEIQKFLGSAASLWAKQRDRLDELEVSYAAERFRKVSAFQSRMQALGNEAADMLRDMDRKHAGQVAEARRMLAALDALRDS
jgi:hypothetical protein